MKKIYILIIIEIILLQNSANADYPVLPGFPFVIEQSSMTYMFGPGVVNINDDPYLEIFFSSSDTTYALDYSGNIIWATNTSHEVGKTMSFADVDNDGYLEILLASRDGYVYILDKDGNYYSGWPKFFGTPAPYYSYNVTTPVAYDLDNNGSKEIIWGDHTLNYQSYLYIVDIEGNNYNGNFPFPVEYGITCIPALGDVDGDGAVEIVFESYDNLYVIEIDGSILPNFPQQPCNGEAHFYNTSPILYDMNYDGKLEIITTASGTYSNPSASAIIIYNYNGNLAEGWPYYLPNFSRCPPSLADLDNDGFIEIIAGRMSTESYGNLLYIMNFDGSLYGEAPYYSFGDVHGPIIIGNIDDEEGMEILYDSNFIEAQNKLGFIQGIHCDGDSLNSFPLRPKGCTMANSGVYGDINIDGILDLICYSFDSSDMDSIWVYAYNLEVPYDPLQIEWKTYQYDFQRLGQYHPPYSFDPPTNVQASADSHGINLSWVQPTNERNYAYSIFRDNNLLTRTPYTTFCDSLVQSYTTYQYYIKSVYEQGFSPPTEIIEITTDSISVDNEILMTLSLSAYPNPFSTSTTISYNATTNFHELSQIKIYNIKGQLVRELLPVTPSPGLPVSVTWDGKDESGKEVKNGVYLYKINNNDEHIGKVVKLR